MSDNVQPASGSRPLGLPQSASAPRVTHQPVEWRYEMRREAQMIIPGLYLGPFQSATKLPKMQQLGITHVLCVRDKRESPLIFPRFPNHFEYYILEISDSRDQNLIRLIPDCLEFIEGAISSGGSVLVHCNGGIALSPAVVVAYLMAKYSWSFNTCLTFVQSKRCCVSPLNFETQLREYEPIYKAMKILQANGVSGLGRGNKRELEEDDETVVEQRRSGHVPRDTSDTSDSMDMT